MATVQWDSIGGKFNDATQLPSWKAQLSSVQKHIGKSISGATVLELACGTGFYTRKAIEWGARQAIGVDISSAMINNARILSKGEEGAEFYVADCSKPFRMGEFDLVMAFWLLNYADTEAKLLAMWQNLHDNMKPNGGRCIGIVPNWDLLPGIPTAGEAMFGIVVKPLSIIADGIAQFHTTLQTATPFSFISNAHTREQLERTARKAGLLDLRWLTPVDPQVPDVLDFVAFSKAPTFQLFTASRSK
ncbi:hypothetical protein ASPZODRAFT_1968839 [Penicilliopsis zonata CBS 506.65]|uniref:Methyltransferase domain-containing protein n=1 Tax=Penicilliopsis zonata CBS 506.65 TaxID=1073090 RepID=A0A1L9SHD2_9EURO|nr:hypothetical protein ASPZODRAFT_1968839 [Penicilliopsis zonata CBS 506.65]OJJ46513.1 hypothetical protein ASPZODRAFT_1968839 [Penicilliopsis zonata CBS 506.65]